MKEGSVLRRVLIALLCVSFMMGSGTAVFAAETAARLKTTFVPGNDNDKLVYAVSFDFAKAGELAKNNLFSARIIIQKNLLKRAGDIFYISPEINCYLEDGTFAGSLQAKYLVAVAKSGKKYVGYIATGKKVKKSGSKVTVRATSKEVIVTVKNIPMKPEAGISKGVSYGFSPMVWFLVGIDKKVKGYVDIDYVTFRAQKKHTSTFEGKDYRNLYGIDDELNDFTVKVVKR